MQCNTRAAHISHLPIKLLNSLVYNATRPHFDIYIFIFISFMHNFNFNLRQSNRGLRINT